MANIWLVVFIAVFTAPIDALTSEVSNRTQNELQTRSIICPSGKESAAFNKNFLENKLPVGLFDQTSKALVYICQDPDNAYYSTLFDKSTMNAILSAYKITWENALRIGEYRLRTSNWRANDIKGLYDKDTYDALYKGAKSMDRGHLNPFAINSFSPDYARSTFVYTNAVPQYSQWNRGAWKEFEKSIRRYTQLTCGCEHRGTMYLITGTSDINTKWIRRRGKFEMKSQRSPNNYIYSGALRRIDIPNSLWTAGCCVWKDKFNNQLAQSIAVMGNNNPDPSQQNTRGMTLKDLEQLLGNKVDLFPKVRACRDNSHSLRVKYVIS